LKCELFFYTDTSNWNSILKHVDKFSESTLFVTNNYGLNDFLKNNNKNSSIVEEIIPEYGTKAEEIWEEAKELRKEYEKIFKNFQIHNVEIFKGFEYYLIQHLVFLISIRKILELKKDIVFVFEEFKPLYYAIKQEAKKIGYDCTENILFIKEDKIETNPNFTNITTKSTNNFSKQRAIRFMKKSFGKKYSQNKIKAILRFTDRTFQFLIKSFMYKIYSKNGNKDITYKILKSIDQKIKSDKTNSSFDSMFFITGVRDDLYLRPVIPVIEQLKLNKKSFNVVTSDISTGLVLSKNNISFSNMFEEVNILGNTIQNTPYGKIVDKIENELNNNNSLIGSNVLANDIISKTRRTISTIIIIEHILKKIKINSIIVASSGEMLEILIASIAKNHKISTISIVPGTANPRPYVSEWFSSSKICVSSKTIEDALIQVGYDKERLFVTGNPKYDYLKKLDVNKARKIISRKYKIDLTKKIIVIGMSRWHENDHVWISELIKFSNLNNIEIIIKTHPIYKIRENDLNKNKLEKIANSCSSETYHVIEDIEMPTLLSASNLLITDYSNTGIEAVLLEKPVISVNISKEDWPDVQQRLEKYNAAIYVENYSELIYTIKDIFQKGEIFETLIKGRGKASEIFNHSNDGRSAERVFKLLDI
jgi:hypothetical protein